jgi:hypothetical protein
LVPTSVAVSQISLRGYYVFPTDGSGQLSRFHR